MKIGIVGTNFVSDSFMEGASYIDDITITCVTSGHIENAQKFAQKYNIETVCESLDEMLEKKIADVIYLAVPNGIHYEMTKKCIFTKKYEKTVDRNEKYGYHKRHSQGVRILCQYRFTCIES